VDATSLPFKVVGDDYGFKVGAIVNLNGRDVIKTIESRFSGAHGDIVHPETAWAALAAADLVGANRGGPA